MVLKLICFCSKNKLCSDIWQETDIYESNCTITNFFVCKNSVCIKNRGLLYCVCKKSCCKLCCMHVLENICLTFKVPKAKIVEFANNADSDEDAHNRAQGKRE